MLVRLADNLASYSELITALSTVGIALLTAVLWLENRRLRKLGTSPEVVAYLQPHSDGVGGVEFVIANVGRGPAFQVSFELLNDEKDFECHRVLLSNDPDRTPIAVLPQDEKMKALIGISFELYGKIGNQDIGPLKPFSVKIAYYNSFGKRSVKERAIDVRQFAGLKGVLAKSNSRKMADTLAGIEKSLSTIAARSQQSPPLIETTEFHEPLVQKTAGGNG